MSRHNQLRYGDLETLLDLLQEQPKDLDEVGCALLNLAERVAELGRQLERERVRYLSTDPRIKP